MPPAYDRFVIRAKFGTPGYDLRYVSQVIHDGSGLPVPARHPEVACRGRPARAHTTGGANLRSRAHPLCPANLRQVRVSVTSRASSSGSASRTSFRGFRLTAPTRIVIDVAH